MSGPREQVSNGAVETAYGRQMRKHSPTPSPLFGIVYFTVCGGTFGTESGYDLPFALKEMAA